MWSSGSVLTDDFYLACFGHFGQEPFRPPAGIPPPPGRPKGRDDDMERLGRPGAGPGVGRRHGGRTGRRGRPARVGAGGRRAAGRGPPGAGVDLPVWALAVGALLTVAVVLLTSETPLRRGGRSSARLAIVAFLAVALSAPDAHAGGAIGWATAVNDFATEGTAVGAAAVVLGILAVGAILMFGITGLITTVVMVCLGGALMAKAQTVASPLFQGGAAGGSIRHVRLVASPAAVPTAVVLPAPRG